MFRGPQATHGALSWVLTAGQQPFRAQHLVKYLISSLITLIRKLRPREGERLALGHRAQDLAKLLRLLSEQRLPASLSASSLYSKHSNVL